MSSETASLPSRHDPAYSLHHIIENAERVARYLASMDRQAFEQNEFARDAVERCIERVCEAAHRLGARAEELMPGQSWGDIRGMGNRLRHAYDRVDVTIVWNTAQERLPALAIEARRALVQLQGEQTDAGASGHRQP
jgi:uncharacterized protein with HEPN domain